MEIRIVLEQTEPPIGRVHVVSPEGRSEAATGFGTAFTGWLGLLRALSLLIDAADASRLSENDEDE